MQFCNLSAEEVLDKLRVNKATGLSDEEAAVRLMKYGKNKLTEEKHTGFLSKFVSQFSDFMVIVLLIAAAISFGVSLIRKDNEYIDSVIILSIVTINAVMGVIQEDRAEKAIDALKKMSAPKATVLRSGREIKIDSEKVVKGDILIIDAGDFVSADARLIQSIDLRVEESSLTGESFAVKKNADEKYSGKTLVADQRNMIFSTGSVTSGHAIAVVTATGMDTEVGKIAGLIEKEKSPQTPLQKRLSHTGKILGIGAMIVCLVIFLLGIFQKTEPLEMFMIAISLAVAAIPEGLPAVVTIVLAIGVRLMAAKKAVVRKLPAVETLGSTTVICSDKTGTITQNKMMVNSVYSASKSFEKEILSFAALCNNARFKGKENLKNIVGEPTECALLAEALKEGIVKNQIETNYKRVKEIPFDSKRKIMTTVHRTNDGDYLVITKGAPDILLEKCSFFKDANGSVSELNKNSRCKIERENNDMANKALRVIAVAYKKINAIKEDNFIESDLTFYGLIGMMDPPRPEIFDAVKKCKEAGIKPVMITGDHVITAEAIAKKVGILEKNSKSVTGAELELMSQYELERNISKYSVFARVSPEHKVRIVKAFQKNGEVVAMTGDGVNDAPALKVSDIGCSMGITGTDVAKNAADMVLTDDNFATIVEAIRQGRGIFDNIRRAIRFLLSSNMGEILTVFSAFLMKMPSPLLAIQLLWVNLVTDSLPALALGVEPIDKDVMKRKPFKRNESLFKGGMWYNIWVEGCFIGAIALLAFVIGRVYFDEKSSILVARTMCFTVLSISQIIHSFNVRSDKSLFKIGFFGNSKIILSFLVGIFMQAMVVSMPVFTDMFKTCRLNFLQWGIVAILSISPIVVVEFEKILMKDEYEKRT